MQIRERAGRIQILRSEYISAEYVTAQDGSTAQKKGTGRSKSRIVGSFNATDARLGVVPSHLSVGRRKDEDAPIREIVDDDELDAIREYVRQAKIKHDEQAQALDLEMLPDMIRRVTENLSDDDISESYAQEIYAAVDDLNKALRKLGFKRPKTTKSDADKPDPRQASFIDESDGGSDYGHAGGPAGGVFPGT